MIMTHVLQTLDILRRISRIQVVWNRLLSYVESDPNEILKISQSIHELGKNNHILCVIIRNSRSLAKYFMGIDKLLSH